MKKKIAVVRGKFLNAYEMQFFVPLVKKYEITAFGSLFPYHRKLEFPVVRLPSPMDLPDYPYKMPFLNRMFTDAHYLLGLENRLRGFDLVHTAETYYHYTQQALNARNKGYVKKVIATVLENIPFNNEGIRGRKKFKLRARTELDHIIALTQKTKEALLKEGANGGKITVISHFIDTGKFFPGKVNKTNKINILFTGRLEIYKGIFDAIYAFNSLIHDPELRMFQLTLNIYGTGTEEKRVRNLIRQLGMDRKITIDKVKYTQMPGIYQRADIFVAPSKRRIKLSKGIEETTWEEQYNTALLEAQASGLAIVTTQSGGIPENVGDAAIKVDPGDNQSIYMSLKKLISDKSYRIKLGQEARKRALQVHDIKIGSRKLAEVYEKVMKE